MKMSKLMRSKLFPALVIVIGALVLVLPQVLAHKMLLGSDSIFHYNRFYEAAMQLKEGNFHYFITMYGFQQSGRIINALYGPVAAYFNGALLLVGKTWFNYQILSDIAVYLLAGGSMYALLRKCKLRVSYSLGLALFYLTTYAIQYWTLSQAFSGWAATLLPLCLLPLVTFIVEKRVNVLELALCTALMFQTHFLTSLFVVMAYLPAFIYSFVKTPERIKMLQHMALAVGLFFLLTANIWAGLVEVYFGNTVLQPFINKNMYGTAVSLNAYRLSNWLSPFGIVILGGLQIILLLLFWKKISTLNKIVSLEAVAFLILSSRLLPWKWLSQTFEFVNVLQFPFRFFVPYTVLLLMSIGLFATELKLDGRVMVGALILLVTCSFVQTIQALEQNLAVWDEPEEFMYQKNTIYFTDDTQKIKQAFFSTDLALGLRYVQKSTPDYLPLYTKLTAQDEIHGYRHYRKQVLMQEQKFTKTATTAALIYQWDATEAKEIIVPAIGYKNTKVVLNGKVLTDAQLGHTRIGTLKLRQKRGHNRLELSYVPAKATVVFLVLPAFVWLGCLGIVIKRKGYNKKDDAKINCLSAR